MLKINLNLNDKIKFRQIHAITACSIRLKISTM